MKDVGFTIDAPTQTKEDHSGWRPSFDSTQHAVKQGGCYLALATVLTLSMVMWSLNPYICCPQETSSMMQVTVPIAESDQVPETGECMQRGVDGPSSSDTMTGHLLARGSPRSLSDSSPYLTPPALAGSYQESRLICAVAVTEKPLSAVLLPFKHPPRV